MKLDPVTEAKSVELAVAAPKPKASPLIISPNWLRTPTAEDMANVYPDREMRLGISGSATLSCVVAASAAAHDGRVSAETPAVLRKTPSPTRRATRGAWPTRLSQSAYLAGWAPSLRVRYSAVALSAFSQEA